MNRASKARKPNGDKIMNEVKIEDREFLEFIEAFDCLKERGFTEEVLLKEKRKIETALRIINEILSTKVWKND